MKNPAPTHSRHSTVHAPVNGPRNDSSVLRRSQFARLAQRDGVRCLFHTLTMRMVFGSAVLDEIFDAFEHGASTAAVIDQYEPQSADIVRGIIASLSENGLLIPDGRTDVHTYQKYYRRGLHQYRIQHIYILPTTACNFRCAYCFVEDEERHQKPCFMDIETAEATVTAFGALTKESGYASVIFYGGEPLLNRKATFYALRRLRELEAQHKMGTIDRMALLTNGSLIDDEAIRVLQETRPNIGVSIDGPQYLHDAARIDEHGHGTFAAAMSGYRRLQDAGLKPGISCTLSASTIGHIDEIVDFIIDDLKPGGMGFNLPLPQTGTHEINAAFDHEFGVQQLIKAFERLRQAGIYEDRVMRRVRPFQSQQLHCKDCMGVGGQIVVTPSGRVGPCQAYLGIDDEKYFPLDIRVLAAKGEQISAAKDIYSHPLFGEWCQRFPLNMKQCADCSAISVCGGGCPYAAAVTTGSIWEVDERVCSQAKNIFEWMIWDTYDHMQDSAGARADDER